MTHYPMARSGLPPEPPGTTVAAEMSDLPRRYEAHIAFVAAARPRAEVWRLIVGCALIVAIYIASIFLLRVMLAMTLGAREAAALFGQLVAGDTPTGMILLLLSFLGLAVGPVLAVRLLHRRRARTLIGSELGLAFATGLRVFLPVLGLQVLLLPFILAETAIRPGLSWGDFLAFLPLALFGIAVQTAAEELAFRGYLQQQLGARFDSAWVWMGLPALLFSFGHYAPAEYGDNAVPIAVWAGLFAVLAADLTARSGNLGAAIGMHLANNIAALLFVGLGGTLDGLALWRLEIDLRDPSALHPVLAVDFLLLIVSWLLARLSLRV